MNKFIGIGWRLVHDTKKVITPPFHSSGTTQSIHTIETFPTEEGCLNRIIELELEYAAINTAKQEVNNYMNS